MAGGDYGRIRHTFWTDPEIKRGLTPGAKLLLVYYCSNAHSNLCGLYYLPLEYAALETGIALDSVRQWTAGPLSRFVTYDERTEEILVHGLAKHQVAETVVETDKRLPRVRKELAAAHSPALVRKFLTLYAEWPIGMQAPPEPDPVERSEPEAPSKPLESPSEAIAVAWQGSSGQSTDTTPIGVDAGGVAVDDSEEVFADYEVIEPAADEPGGAGKVLVLRPHLQPDPSGGWRPPFEGRSPDEPVNGGQIMAEWINRKRPSLSRHDRGRQAAAAQRIADGRTLGELALAMIGIECIWPFAPPSLVKGSEGRRWDLMDLEKHFDKALGAWEKHPAISRAREDAEWEAAFDQAEGF